MEGDLSEPRALRLAPEREILPEVALAALKAGPPGGGWTTTRIGGYLPPEELSQRVAGRVGGAPRPSWSDGRDGARRGPLAVTRARDIFFAPRHGVVLDAEGRVFQTTAAEMLSWKDDLGLLPHVRRAGSELAFAPPADLPRLPAATVFMAKGGAFNYGHFLLDCLPSLLAVEEVGLIGEAPPLAPPLARWQRDLLRLAFPEAPVAQTKAAMVRLDEAVFASSLDHFLHRPNRILLDLRERLLVRAPPPTAARRVYISRRAYPMRVMVNEPALEAALAMRGFRIVRAERLSVAEQIALVRGAEVVVGAAGAGLANALVAPPGCKVVEILPDTFAEPWLRNLVHLSGGDWMGYFCPAPVDASEVSWRYRVRRGFRWGYRLPLGAFLTFLDERV
jgi:capsular polysaccharide biosynthesis protein